MFRDAILFNEDLNNWERSDSTLVNVVNMDSMFYNSEVFNHDIGKWNVSSVTNMSSMFRDAIVFNNSGNNNMKNWDVSSVTTMDFMFYNCGALNEDIGRWNVSSVVNMSSMFQGAAIFNQNITQWNISSVTNMNNMFQDAVVFDQNIRHWDTLGATTYDSMFDSANAMIATYNGVTGFGTTPTSSFFSLGFSTKTIGNIVEVIFSGTGSLTSTTVTNGIATVLPIGAGNILKVLVIGYDSVGTAFQNNTNINVVDLNGVVKNTGQTQGLDASAFSGCTNLSEITLFHYCEVVGSLAFNNATSLKKIYEIPSGLTSVASDAFNGTNVNVKTIFDITNGVTNRDASSSSATLIFNPSSPKTKTNVQQTYDVTVTGTLDSDINYVATKVFLETINAGFVPNNNAELKMAVEKWFGGIINAGSVVPSGQGSGNYGNMSTWNISKVTNMSEVFRGVTRSFTSAEDITGWNMSNVTNMSSMFHGATRFNQNIGSWDVSNVIDMSSMFQDATGFNQNIGSWDVSNVIDMSSMFQDATGFNQNIGSWDVSNVIDMSSMFQDATGFNQNIGSWNVSNVIDMSSMFQDATGFNQNIGSWDVSSVTNMSHMFYDTTLFNQNIVGWTVSNVINMSYMFQGATLFNQDINVWIVNSNTNLTNMFLNSGITNGTYGFSVPTPTYLQFDQPVPLVDGPKTQIGTLKWAVTTFLNGGWTTQYQSTYGTTMNDWNVFYVTNMNDIFQGASTFNENISKWKVSNVTNMSAMFDGASLFNQDISLWDVSNVTDMSLMFWNATAFNEPIVNWDTSNVTDMGFMFRNARSFNKNIDGWDVSSVTNMRNMFQGSLVFNQFIGDWNVSSVINMSYMFDGAIVFNQSLNNWVVSNITGFFTKGATCSDNNSGEGMKCMFKNATSFNQPLDKWDVKKVITMESMFEGASSFNQDVSAWKPLNVKTMKAMFKGATYYNNNPTAWIESQALVGNPRRGTNNIDTWGKPNHRKGEAYRAVISNVEDFSSMFENALTFDRRIISWPISQTDCLTNMVKNSGLSNIDSLGQGFNNISTPTYTYFNKVVCFNEGTRILCLKGGKDQYIRIGRLKVGDRVKTLNHGYKKIIDLRKGNYRLNRLADMGIYKMKKQGNMIADLEMTGLHCILVDPNDSKYADDIKRQGGLKNEKFFVDGKFRLRANQSHEFEQMECKDYTIYSFALEDQQEQYGIWANGVLAETTSKRILEISNMQKIGSLKKDTFSIFSK
jgi:surface protein